MRHVVVLAAFQSRKVQSALPKFGQIRRILNKISLKWHSNDKCDTRRCVLVDDISVVVLCVRGGQANEKVRSQDMQH